MTDYGQPYWWDGQAQPNMHDTLPAQCDLLIIGAGYTGLSAAITAAGQGADVCVVDAQYPGYGASTRNGGMAGAHPRLSLDVLSKQFGSDTARQIFNEAGAAFDHFKSLLNQFKIACDYQQTGRIQLAWTKADFNAQQNMAAAMTQQTDFAVQVLQRDELRAHIQTNHYFGGLYYPDHGALHPHKFLHGLLDGAMAQGAKIVPNCPIHTISRDKSGFMAAGPSGAIYARKIILASNGYTTGGKALHWLARRVFALPSYLIATEVLPDGLINQLAPGRRMMVETRARHSYWRISPDGRRIIWGGRAAIRPIDLKRAAKRLHHTMAGVWPALHDVKITHAWMGNTGYTFNNMPQVGAVDGVHYAAGYCGGGVVMAPYLGMKVAYQALGDPRGETAYTKTDLATRPYYLGGRKPWFLRPADHWYNLVVDPLQTAAARRDRAGQQAPNQ